MLEEKNIPVKSIDPDPALRFSSAGEMEAALADRSPRPSPIPIIPDPVRVASTERTAFQKIELAAIGLAITALTIEVLGLVASSAFESALHIDHDFAAGPIEWFWEGVLALGPWTDAIRAALAMDPGALPALEPVWRAELARVLPEADERGGRRRDPASVTRISISRSGSCRT